jgi:hypothetical protein
MAGFVRRELEGCDQCVQHAVGRVSGVALFEAGVVADTDPGELGDLLAAESRRTARWTVDKPSSGRSQPASALTEERTEFAPPPGVPRHVRPPDCP